MRGDRRAAYAFALLTAALAGPPTRAAEGQATASQPPSSVQRATSQADGPTPAVAPPPPGEPAYVDVIVNAIPGETTLVYVTPDGDVWVPVAEIARTLRVENAGVQRDHEGLRFVSLRSLEPELRFELDETALAVRITAGPAFTGQSRLDLRSSKRPPGLTLHPATSAFLNYGVQGAWDDRTDAPLREGQLSASAELGLSRGTALFLTSATRRNDGELVRGLSTLTWERPERLLRLGAGDLVASGDGLGGSAILLGVGIAHDLALDPYLVRAPLPSSTTFAATPSVLEVWVNGTLVRQIPVAPGSYELANLPVTNGTNEVRTVLRDAFGRAEVVDSSQYLAAGLLAPGLRDWSVHLGFERQDYGAESFAYGRPMLFARHQAGWTSTLTSGLRLEAGEELASAGASLLLATPLGEVETGLAGSIDEERLGAAGLLAWRWSSRMLATTTYLRLMSPRYAHASLAATGPRDLWRAGVSLTAPARWGSLTVDYSASHPDLGGVVERTGVRALFWFAPGAAFSVHGDVTRTPQVGWTTSAYANVTVTIAARTSASTGASVVDERLGATAAVQRDLPAGTGVGYRLNGFAVQDAWNGSATLQAQSGFGRYELVVDRSDGGSTSGRTSASGAVIGIGRKAFFTRPVTSGYALVRVPGVDGVRAFRENREVGRTDDDGDLLVPDLLAHYANHLSISDKDIPQDFDIRETKKTMAVPRRGGTLAVFDVAPLRAVTGVLRVIDAGETITPANGTLSVESGSGPLESPIGSDGLFWLEGLSPGGHPATITWKGGRCRFTLAVPAESGATEDLGFVSCERR